MGKRFRDTLVGIFIVIGIVLFIVLYTWLTGRIGMRNTRDVRVYFRDVGGLRVGDPVLVYGIEKGKIKRLAIENESVLVVVAVSKEIPLDDDSEFTIRSVSYLGGDKYIKINPGKSGRPGMVFAGKAESFSIETIGAELSKAIQAIENFKMPDLSRVGDQLTVTLNKQIEDFTGVLAEPVGRLGRLASRLDSVAGLMQGDGTVGRLLKSGELYDEIRETNRAVRELVDDLKANPQKYINLKDIKIF